MGRQTIYAFHATVITNCPSRQNKRPCRNMTHISCGFYMLALYCLPLNIYIFGHARTRDEMIMKLT